MSLVIANACLPVDSGVAFAAVKNSKSLLANKSSRIELQFSPEPGGTGGGISEPVPTNVIVKQLRSKLPNPSQESLDAVLDKADRVKVYAGGESKGKPLSEQVLLDSQSRKVLSALSECLHITNQSDVNDMCSGDPTIELLAGKKRLAVIGFHHARAIRWSKGWKFDASLADGRRLAYWFNDNGIPGPLQAYEAEIRELRRSSAELQKWRMSMPECLRPYIQEMMALGMPDMLVYSPEPNSTDPLNAPSPAPASPGLLTMQKVLAEDFSNRQTQILAMLQWYASGTGRWTGYPMYEDLPAHLLVMIPTEQIIQALQSASVSEPELEGAARFFASYTFRKSKPQDIALLPTALKQNLLGNCLKSADPEIQKRGKRAFADSETVKTADN
ncbi:MAG: hypothetical protein K2X27_23575 [Candidatus Obscuribacterales bacterium]|nr:hypothetical protein [Candidatus Obscuribacterales bacterium]